MLGELLAGLGSDLYVAARTKRAGGVRKPEYRLALAYPGFAFTAAGILGRFLPTLAHLLQRLTYYVQSGPYSSRTLSLTSGTLHQYVYIEAALQS